MRHGGTAIAVVFVLALAGCGLSARATTSVSTSKLTPTATAMPTPTATPTPTPTTAAVPVHRADIDGDGRLDSVAVSWVRLERPDYPRGDVRVTVTLAHGGRLSTVVPIALGPFQGEGLAALPWVGASPLLGGRNADVVLQYDAGAHSITYVVLADEDGRLRRIPSPPGDEGTLAWGWFANSSVGTGQQALQCSARGMTYSAMDPDGSTTTYTSRWDGGRWIVESRRSFRVNPAYADAGFWRGCPGIAAYG